MKTTDTKLRWQDIKESELIDFAGNTATDIEALNKWEKAALKNAFVLDIPGFGIDVRCTNIDKLMHIFYDSSLTPYQIIEHLHPTWKIESINSKWLRLVNENDTVEFEVIGDEIGYISVYWKGEEDAS